MPNSLQIPLMLRDTTLYQSYSFLTMSKTPLQYWYSWASLIEAFSSLPELDCSVSTWMIYRKPRIAGPIVDDHRI